MTMVVVWDLHIGLRQDYGIGTAQKISVDIDALEICCW